MKNEINKKDEIPKLKKVLDHHIALGVEAIFSGVFMGNEPSKGSLHHLLNRVMMACQAPLTFLLYERIGEKYEYKGCTNRHPNLIHQRTIENQAKKCKEEHHKYLNPLWIRESSPKEKFYLAVLKADTDKFEPLQCISSFEYVDSIWSAIAYKLHHILDESRYSLYGDTFYGYLIGSIRNLIGEDGKKLIWHTSNNNKSKENHSRRMLVKKEIRDEFDKHLLINTTQYALSGKGVMDYVFEKLKKAISAISMQDDNGSPHNVTNFLFYVRDYDDFKLKGNQRYNEYDYNIRLLVGSKQEADIIKHLATWKTLEKYTELNKKFEDQLNNFKDKKDLISLAKSINASFWKELMKDGTSGIKELVKNFSKEFGNETRSIADPVMDGVSFYRAPFNNDCGIGRSFERLSSLGGDFESLDLEKKNDLLRVITFFYLLSSMATRNNYEKDMELRVMLNPIECGGRVWAVCGYATYSFKNLDMSLTDDKIDEYNRFWMQNYHICYDVNERMKKNLRTCMNALYEQTIAAQYVSWIGEIAQKIAKAEAIDLDEEEARFNDRLKQLTCLFPYDMVQVRIESSKDEKPKPSDEKCQAFFAKNYAAIPHVKPESFFLNTLGVTKRNFVNPTDVAIAMTDQILRTILEIKSAKNVKH